MNHWIEIAIICAATLLALAYLVRKGIRRFAGRGKACGGCGGGCGKPVTASSTEVKPATLTIGGRNVV